MKNRFITCATLAALLPLTSLARPAAAQKPAPPANLSVGRATWDSNYLYFAFQVYDPDISGTDSTPLGQPEKDDSVGVYFQTGAKLPDAPDTNTHAMIVSAAGGFTFLDGDAAHKLTPRPLRSIFAQRYSLKYSVSLQGTLNRNDDRDKGYTIEMAVPWEALGIKAADLKPGLEIGYNVVVRARGTGLTALSPGVRSEGDTVVPAKWGYLTLAAPTQASVTRGTAASQIADGSAPPVIDGAIRTGEWNDLSLYSFAVPVKKLAPIAAVPAVLPSEKLDAQAPPLRLDAPLGEIGHLLLARYSLAFQGDMRKPTLFRGVRSTETGVFLLRDQPATGAGPWFSSDRTGWHRAQLIEMERTGINAALVELGAPDSPDAAADQKALMVLVAALREMTFEQIDTPQIALYLDTRTFGGTTGAKVDLGTTAGRDLLYAAIRRWMLLVPPEYRLATQLPLSEGGIRAYPIFLSDASAFTHLDQLIDGLNWVEEMRRRFATEFGTASGGATLLTIGGTSFVGTRPVLAGYFPTTQSGLGSGSLPIFVVQPGLDADKLIPRREGATYREVWDAALASKANWILLDSWNDWRRGTEVASSRQYGSRYLDMTRVYALQAGGSQAQDLLWLTNNAPRRMHPGQLAVTELQVQNSGLKPLRGSDGIVLSYRWLQNGKPVAESPLRIPLAYNIYPAQIARLSLGVASVKIDASGKAVPLAPGKYVLQINLRPRENPVQKAVQTDEPPIPSLFVPVTVSNQILDTIEWDGTTTPTLLESGATYPVSVRVRWNGKEAIEPSQARLVYQITNEKGETVATGSSPVTQPITPGQWTTLRAYLRLADTGGAPIPSAFPEVPEEGTNGGYRLRWLLTRTDSTAAIAGEYFERIAVYPGEEEARILPPKETPPYMDAGAQVPMEITVINRGHTRWLKKNTAIGYHWYFADGVEAIWKPTTTTPLPRDLEAGGAVKVPVLVTAPERDGLYVLAFDVVGDGAEGYLSTHPLTRTGDLGLAYVRVRGGRLTFVDLSKFFNIDAVASEAKPDDGDLNGVGSTLPSESFPPDRYGLNAAAELYSTDKKAASQTPPAYPSGYYAEVSSARLISFRYGSDADGMKNAVACMGQSIPTPRERFVGLHIAALATGGDDRPFPITLRYRDGKTTTVNLTVGDWNRAPLPTEPVAILAHRKRTPQGDVAATCAVYHLILPVSVDKELQSITLPKDSKIKVFAITLER